MRFFGADKNKGGEKPKNPLMICKKDIFVEIRQTFQRVKRCTNTTTGCCICTLINS